MFLLSMIKYPKFLGAGAAQDTGAINCVVSLPRLRSVCSGLQAALSRCIPQILDAAPQSSVLTLTPPGIEEHRSRGRGAECRPQSHPERDNKTCEDWGGSDQSEARGEAR